ncbi:MAG: hypothetical protein UX17_C0010G0001, partial [Parcubacteria group bacterium GW2011_GWC2_45_7]
AMGTLSSGDRVDWFAFDVSGEPQLWTIEGSGAGLGRLGIQGAGDRRLAERDIRGKTSVRIDHLQLFPGRYWVSVKTSRAGGDYRLRAIPTGKPARESEFEPNDDPSQAQVLRFGEPRRGSIAHPDDRDMYRFSIDSATHLALTLSPPPDTRLTMTIDGNTPRITGNRRAKSGEPSYYEAFLQAGDYSITVHGEGGSSSDTPYELRLDFLDPFSLPTDLEPNDQPSLARSLEKVRRFSGTVGSFRGEDWFLLPAVKAATTASIRFSGKIGLNLRRVEGGRVKYGKLLEAAPASSGGPRVYSATLEPGIPTYLQVNGSGEYAVDLALEPEPVAVAVPLPPSAGLDLALQSKPPPIAAFREEAQRVPLEFSVTNRDDRSHRVELETASAAEGWRITPAGEGTLLGPGQSGHLRATLIAGPDRIPTERLPLYVRARSEGAVSSAVELPVRVLCGVALQSAQRDAPLPPPLLGGFNVAWQPLGAEPVGDEAARRRLALLFDGMTPLGQALAFDAGKLPADITVKLASQHLVLLAHANFLQGIGKVGSVYYSLNPALPSAVRRIIEKDIPKI